MLRDTLTKQMQSLSKALEEVRKLRKLERVDKAIEVLSQNLDTELLYKLQSEPTAFGDPKLSEQIKYLIYFQYQQLKIAETQNLAEVAIMAAALHPQIKQYLAANEHTYYIDLQQIMTELESLE